MKREKVSFKSAGGKLVGIKEIPEKIPAPGVILLHGLSGSKEDSPLINESSKALVENGFIAFRFDFYGSGESPGKMQNKTMAALEQNAKDAVDYFLKDQRVTNLGLWGRSIGGTLVCLLPPNRKIKARVSASGASLAERETREKLAELKLREQELERREKKLLRAEEDQGKFAEFDRSLKGLDKKVTQNLKQIGTILVLGTTPDKEVSLQNACYIINNTQEPKKIWIFEGVGHDYAGAEKEAVMLTVDWFNQWLR